MVGFLELPDCLQWWGHEIWILVAFNAFVYGLYICQEISIFISVAIVFVLLMVVIAALYKNIKYDRWIIEEEKRKKERRIKMQRQRYVQEKLILLNNLRSEIWTQY